MALVLSVDVAIDEFKMPICCTEVDIPFRMVENIRLKLYNPLFLYCEASTKLSVNCLC